MTQRARPSFVVQRKLVLLAAAVTMVAAIARSQPALDPVAVAPTSTAAASPASASGRVPTQPDARCGGTLDTARPLPQQSGPKPVLFEASAFPYDGDIPGENKKFLDRNEGGRRGHTSPRGSLHWEDQSYSDKHSLLYVPKGFDISLPAVMVVFFHGNHATLQRDVLGRQRVPTQLAASGLNAVLVAPQLAYDVADSSAGWFWHPGFFDRYLAEAARHLASLSGDPCLQPLFDRMPVVLVAYSGGYNPAAYALDVGGADGRIQGVILLDALYGEIDKFAQWVERHGSTFFFSAYSLSSQAENLELQSRLAAHGIQIQRAAGHGLQLKAGSVTFLATSADVRHNDFVTDAWVHGTLAAVLTGVEGFHRPYAGAGRRDRRTTATTAKPPKRAYPQGSR